MGSSPCALKRFGDLLSGLTGKEMGVAALCPLGWGGIIEWEALGAVPELLLGVS